MDRRAFLLLGAAAVAAPTATLAECKKAVRECNPDMPDKLVGTDNRTPKLHPTLCLGQTAYDLITLQRQGDTWVRLTEFAWSYGLMYPNGQAQFYQVQVQNRRCWDRQSVHSKTRFILWMNCISREDGRWYRHWFKTDKVTNNGEYTLEEYHVEPARSYTDKPKNVPSVS